MPADIQLSRALADLQDRLQALEGQVYRLAQSEGLIGQHGGQHNGGLGDEVAIAVWENGTIQDALHGLNLGAQFSIAPNAQFDRHDITIASLVQTLLTGTAWRVGYTNGSGVFTELALGAVGTYLRSAGAAANPTFQAPAPTELVGGNWKVIYTNGAGAGQELTLGAAGTALVSGGASAAPSFVDVATQAELTTHEGAADPHTGYMLESLLDAKGDLIAASAADTPAKVTVGANDTILMADSAQAAGLKWAASQTPSTQAFGDAAAEGTADTYARGDHKHGMPSSPAPTLVRKTANESVTSSDVLQNDDALLLAIAANERWAFRFVLLVSSGNGGDFQVAITVPAGATFYWHVLGGHHTDNTSTPTDRVIGSAAVEASGSSASRGTNGGSRVMVIDGEVSNGGTAGNLQLQFAQVTSDATATTVYADSYLSAQKF